MQESLETLAKRHNDFMARLDAVVRCSVHGPITSHLCPDAPQALANRFELECVAAKGDVEPQTKLARCVIRMHADVDGRKDGYWLLPNLPIPPEVYLAIVQHRLEQTQLLGSTCDDTTNALEAVQAALQHLHNRSRKQKQEQT